MPKGFLLNLPGIASRTCFESIKYLVPLLVISYLARWDIARALRSLLLIPGLWLLGHTLWITSDSIFFFVNRAEARLDDRGFFLLLRPFRRTAATSVPGSPEVLIPGLGNKPVVWSRGPHPLIWDYGVILAPLGRLVAVGPVRLPKPVLSNDTVTVLANNDNWREMVAALAKRSRAILVLFDEGKGIVDEMRYLCDSGLTEKTIIRVSGVLAGAVDPTVSQQRWNEGRILLQQHGYKPPEATREGFLYIPKSDLSILYQAPFGRGPAHQSAINELLGLIPHSPNECSLREAMKFVSSIEALHAKTVTPA